MAIRNIQYDSNDPESEYSLAKVEGIMIRCPKLGLIMVPNIDDNIYLTEEAHYCSGHEYYYITVSCPCGEIHEFKQ